jgi:hypothetical protein
VWEYPVSDLDDLASLDLEALEDERDDLEQSIAEIKGQLETAQAIKNETGKYADAKWYVSAKQAMRFKQIELNRVQRVLKKRRTDRLELRDRAWEQAFVKLAKQTLNEATYDRLVAMAWEEIGEIP